MIGPHELDFARRLVGLILGIDDLYRSRLAPDLHGLAREGYVAINLSQVAPTLVSSYTEARTAAADLREELDGLEMQPGRKQYFGDYLHAIDTFCRWQDLRDVPYPELVQSLLGVPGEPPRLEPLIQAVDAALRNVGYEGETAAMIAAFRQSRLVPREAVADTLERYLGKARAWVERELFPLPEDFQFRVVGETGVPYNAYCGYVEREVRINLDLPFTHEDLKHLACHEAYPGHSTQIVRHEELVGREEMTEDGLLIVTDTPTTTLFEGIGELGLTLLGWDQSDPERIGRHIGRLRSAVDAWAGYLFASGRRDEGMELMLRYGDASSTKARQELLDLPLRCPFIYAYFYGDQVVHRALAAAQDRKGFLHHLYDLNHSPASLVMA